MRKIIGIGETIFDIIFQGGQPTAGVPGGSAFNCLISLGRTGLPVTFISETGNDRVGEIILSFMRENGVSTDYMHVYPDGKSAISLAFLNEQSDAQYQFYKDYPACRLEVDFPAIEKDDLVVFGSYFALNPVLRAKVSEFLSYARHQGAIIYYDVNFRSTHTGEMMKLTPTIIENFEFSDIVRGSDEDFDNMYQLKDADDIYKQKVSFYCPNFICTRGGRGVSLRTRNFSKDYSVAPLTPVSTIGAGDNFNAGILFGLMRYRIRRDDLPTLTERDWDDIIQCGIDFSSHVCMSLNNSISREFAEEYAKRR
ncbi:MAG: carbohydrate kinase [Bacteroidaceae bacterium]|nr:carbohydrate kinase [Bacteroidaceae bacterium]